MCFLPKPPKLDPLPAAPTPNDASVQKAREAEAARLANSGTASTVKTDLAPSAVTTQKRVLLGQ